MKRCIILFISALIICFACSSFVFTSFATNEESSESTDIPETDPPVSDDQVIRSVSPVTPNDANGLKKIMLQLIGNYETVVTEHRYTNPNGYTSISVSTEPDYSWLCSCAIFLLVLFCVFRLMGGVICGKR